MAEQALGVFSDGELLLHCPRCGGEYLHHGRVDVYQRTGEDADRGMHVAVGGGSVAVYASAPMGASPSSRRDGLTVGFWCEGCSELSFDSGDYPHELCIVQHKGQTFVSWRERRRVP